MVRVIYSRWNDGVTVKQELTCQVINAGAFLVYIFVCDISCFAEVVLEFPDVVKNLHTEYARAGSDVILAFTSVLCIPLMFDHSVILYNY